MKKLTLLFIFSLLTVYCNAQVVDYAVIYPSRTPVVLDSVNKEYTIYVLPGEVILDVNSKVTYIKVHKVTNKIIDLCENEFSYSQLILQKRAATFYRFTQVAYHFTKFYINECVH